MASNFLTPRAPDLKGSDSNFLTPRAPDLKGSDTLSEIGSESGTTTSGWTSGWDSREDLRDFATKIGLKGGFTRFCHENRFEGRYGSASG
ncbi:hypothetical protein QE152_g7454 [Popillia japonica]|uniref:Uncharacterized protein n=1 Tax=Popillia japonica TaxID=7064 RepID=A0AAW1MG28_POPJA